jgi:hypothetical protein
MVTEEDPKTTEELVFSTLAISYALKSLKWNCRSTQKLLWQKHKMDSERDGHTRTQLFALNY